MDSAEIKKIIKELGADICGIASVERFNDAPKGFHPTDIQKDCKSVIVFGIKIPDGVLSAETCVPYTHINHILCLETDVIATKASMILDELGIKTVPIPSDDPYEHWEPERSYGMAILSLRHAGQLAGLGVMGKNTLLVNKDFGNMMRLGALLTDITLDGDPIVKYDACPSSCSLCIDKCPQKALDTKTVNQKLCRPLATYKTEKGYTLMKCYVCRKVCPNALGVRKDFYAIHKM